MGVFQIANHSVYSTGRTLQIQARGYDRRIETTGCCDHEAQDTDRSWLQQSRLKYLTQGAQKLPIIYKWIKLFFSPQLIAILGSSLDFSLQELSWRKETIQKIKLYTAQLWKGLILNIYKLYFPQTLLMAVKGIQQLQQDWTVPECVPCVFLVTLIHWGMSVQVENSAFWNNPI